MSQQNPAARSTASFRGALVGAALVAGLGFGAPKQAQALTIVLNFVNASTTDIFGVTAIPESFAGWGFTGLNLAGIRAAALSSINTDYLGYPTVGADAASPLPNGKELNINFAVSSGLTGPGNGDSEWYYVNIGDAQPNQGFLGQACLGCVRGGVPTANGNIVGSILTDTISGLLGLASSDAQRMNLLAGTIAHEVGHTLTLVHPPGAQPNPGASPYSIMGTGAGPTNMPNSERVKDRAFAYTEFSTLINTVGLRNVAVVPEPGTSVLLALGVLALAFRLHGSRRQA